MSEYLPLLATVLASLLASSGLWTYLQYRHSTNSAEVRLIRGIGYTMLMNQCMAYIRRGRISPAEYVELSRMLYDPYVELGGNGAAERAYEMVKKLPISTESVMEEIAKDMRSQDGQQK